MADNAIVKILTALLKHQVKRTLGEETLGVIGQELAGIGGDKVDAWIGEQATPEQFEKAAIYAHQCFRGKVNDNDLEQWMVSLPLGNLPKVVEALEELPKFPDETKLENALQESVSLNWKNLSDEQVNNAVNAFLSCLRNALLPIEKQTLMVIGRSVLRTEDKVDLLVRWFEQYIITGKPAEIKLLNPEPADYWNLKHPYPMPPNFTGRVDERKMLVDWLNKDNENHLFILRALGGFGKSALAWQWLTHDVDSKEWPKVLWWSFYEGDASFEHFIEETLKYLKLEVPQGQRPQVDELLKAMQGGKILLIMDGFERALRAYSSMNAAYQGDEEQKLDDNQYDCVNINAEIFLKSVCSLPNIRGKVLMTTRLTPRAVNLRGEILQGCCEEELIAMQPADAVEFFHKQKIKGTHTEIKAACAPYGYHPLSLRLLAGRILKDFENPADIVVAQKLKIDGDIIQQKHHVLEVSYNSLPPHEQKLLSMIACFRSPVEIKVLEWNAEDKNLLHVNLRDLVDRGLVYFIEKSKEFDLHPIVRHYCYEHLTAPERIAAHRHMESYFSTISISTDIKTIEDLTPFIELYHHIVRAERLDGAFALFHDVFGGALYTNFSAYQIIIELLEALFIDGENKPPPLKKEVAQVKVLNTIANSYSLSGKPDRAAPLFKMEINILEQRGEYEFLAMALSNMGLDQIRTGALKNAEHIIRRSIDLLREAKEEFTEAGSHTILALVLSYCGVWEAAAQEQERALSVVQDYYAIQPEIIVWANRALHFLLIARFNSQSKTENLKSAIESASRACKLVAELGSHYPDPQKDVRASWLLGAAYRANGDLIEAQENLSKAISLCRQINLVVVEGDILLDLARLRYDQKKYEEAKSLAEESLTITERCGYVLQGADVNLFLAQYALEQEQDKAKAKEYAEEAKKLATCDGPPYYYKVAYEEAVRMLESLKV